SLARSSRVIPSWNHTAIPASTNTLRLDARSYPTHRQPGLSNYANWKAFNSYTHTSYFAVDRHLNGQTIGSSMSDEQICEMLGFADAIALMTALEFADLARDGALKEKLVNKAAEISSGVFRPHKRRYV
ncbi:MAG: DUF6988 family protein, partial [Stellaceae bacterium]